MAAVEQYKVPPSLFPMQHSGLGSLKWGMARAEHVLSICQLNRAQMIAFGKYLCLLGHAKIPVGKQMNLYSVICVGFWKQWENTISLSGKILSILVTSSVLTLTKTACEFH